MFLALLQQQEEKEDGRQGATPEDPRPGPRVPGLHGPAGL